MSCSDTPVNTIRVPKAFLWGRPMRPIWRGAGRPICALSEQFWAPYAPYMGPLVAWGHPGLHLTRHIQCVPKKRVTSRHGVPQNPDIERPAPLHIGRIGRIYR